MPVPTSESEPCPICQVKELAQTKHELNECKKRGQSKDRTIKQLNKRVFILTAVAVGIGAIFGKEALDSITEWLGSVKAFKSSVQDLSGVVVPAPGTLFLFALLPLMVKSRRRR
tara:strand:- start:210 stop:551 length:342 start_codon:yes stop_codon:yes gene_type:complete